MKVFISTTSFAQYDSKPIELLDKFSINFNANSYKRKLSEEEIKEVLKSNDYCGLIAGTETLSRDVLVDAKSLQVISRVGTSIDNVDLTAAKDLGIKIFNTPDGPTDAVAELTIGFILSALRKINLADRNMRSNLWKKEMGFLFKGKCLGIIGMGKIGQRVAQIALSFGAEVIFSDLRKVEINGEMARKDSLEELLKTADIISLHASGKDLILSQKEIDLMKKGSILVNLARGSLIDEVALHQALASSKIEYAALDVFSHEPYQGSLRELDNVLLTPHIGSYAKEARSKMEIEAVENLLRGLNYEI